jgi:hypothetical protein
MEEHWRHVVQQNDIQDNDVQHNDIQHNDILYNGLQRHLASDRPSLKGSVLCLRLDFLSLVFFVKTDRTISKKH